VFIRYFGACGGCPIGQGGTLNFIEMTLQQKVDPRLQVKVIENF
jgi:Fe-S cluster biogenesis protein NfuA